MTMLQTFDDRDVTQCAIRITRAGDGLSASLDAAPVELHHGEEVYVVLRCNVTKVTLEGVRDTDLLRRVHTLAAQFGTIVDEKSVHKVMDQARQRVEAALGVQRIPGVDEPDDEG